MKSCRVSLHNTVLNVVVTVWRLFLRYQSLYMKMKLHREMYCIALDKMLATSLVRENPMAWRPNRYLSMSVPFLKRIVNNQASAWTCFLRYLRSTRSIRHQLFLQQGRENIWCRKITGCSQYMGRLDDKNRWKDSQKSRHYNSERRHSSAII